MPYLSPEDREALGVGKAVSYKCHKCGRVPTKNYCRSCDEFFNVCGCTPEPDKPGSFYKNDHSKCRTY